MKNLLTISEAAEMLNIHPETLRRWDRNGTLNSVRVNDRGDRRYELKVILNFLENKKLGEYDTPINHHGYKIYWDLKGVVTLSASFERMARFIVKKSEDDFIGFIFFISILNSHHLKKEEIEKLAIEKIKETIDSSNPSDGERFTFEMVNEQFCLIENPDWWEEKYSKILIPGLMIVAEHSCPYSSSQKAWRVSLRFKSKQGGFWVTNQFGEKNQFHEYYLWISSEELIKLGLSNTAKSAEVLAINFGISRFEKTKDSYGDRDISRINENNSALFNDEWHIDSLLPEDLN